MEVVKTWRCWRRKSGGDVEVWKAQKVLKDVKMLKTWRCWRRVGGEDVDLEVLKDVEVLKT